MSDAIFPENLMDIETEQLCKPKPFHFIKSWIGLMHVPEAEQSSDGLRRGTDAIAHSLDPGAALWTALLEPSRLACLFWWREDLHSVDQKISIFLSKYSLGSDTRGETFSIHLSHSLMRYAMHGPES